MNDNTPNQNKPTYNEEQVVKGIQEAMSEIPSKFSLDTEGDKAGDKAVDKAGDKAGDKAVDNNNDSVVEDMHNSKDKYNHNTERFQPYKPERNTNSDKYTYDDDYDDYNESWVSRHPVIYSFVLIIFVAAISIVGTYLFMTLTGGFTDGYLRNQNKEYERTIEEMQSTIESKESELSELQTSLDEAVEQNAESEETIDGLNEDIDELEDKVAELQDDIAELRLELIEAQYRADMYQKYGPGWEV